MKGHLKVQHHTYGELNYFTDRPGKVELKNVSPSHNIVVLYFTDFKLLKAREFFYDEETELMLTNYPVEIKFLEEFDGITLEIDDGWTSDCMLTMLSVNDGDPVDRNKINFIKNNNDSFQIRWTGQYRDYNSSELSTFSLDAVAVEDANVVTPLCLSKDELITLYSANG